MVDDNKKKFTDELINNILYKLTIISYVKQGEKLCCYDNNIIIDDSYIQSISRFFSNQKILVSLKRFSYNPISKFKWFT